MANLCPYGGFALPWEKGNGFLWPELHWQVGTEIRRVLDPQLQIDSCGELSMHINDVRHVCILRAMEGHRAFFGGTGFWFSGTQ